jgi:ABC-type polysaccharide/polyol phosphate transport system, ATPase component
MSKHILEFNHVWKKFKRGEKLNSLRDAIPNYLSLLLSRKKGADSLDKEEFWAVKDFSFSVKQGDILGIIGPNGAGKSTVLKLLSRIMIPDKGKLSIGGRLSAIIEVTAGFHPELTGRENVYLNGTILGMSKKEIDGKFDEIVAFSGLKEFINTPVKRYSSGMFSRLGFSVAAHMDPDILLVDEVLSVGDMAFQGKCVRKMKDLLHSGTTIVLVSHDLGLVQNLCKRVILMNGGTSIKEGPAEEVIPYYQDLVYKKDEEELKRMAESSSYRVQAGDGTKIAIRGVTLHTGDSRRRERFNADEPIVARIDFTAAEKIERPVFSLEIIRSDGVICCDSSTLADGYPIESIEGEGALEIGLGRLNVVPGIYLIRITVWDKDILHPYVVRKNDIFRFERDNLAGIQKGVFITNYTWKILESVSQGVEP